MPPLFEQGLWPAQITAIKNLEKSLAANKPRTDEAHRSIYTLWRQVLEYFDAYLIGLTATPSKQTFGFFNQNLVMEYGHEQAVADGVMRGSLRSITSKGSEGAIHACEQSRTRG